MESSEAAYQRDYRRRRKLNGGARLTQPVAVLGAGAFIAGVPWPDDPAARLPPGAPRG